MKKVLLFFVVAVTHFATAQTLIPVYEYMGDTSSPQFVVENSSQISLIPDRNGVANGAMNFPQDHGYLSLNLSAANKTALMSEGTISMWYKHEGTGTSAFGQDKPLVMWSNGNSSSFSQGITMGLLNGKIIARSYSGTPDSSGPGTSGNSTEDFPTDGSWNHFTITWKRGAGIGNNYVKVYLNGTLVINPTLYDNNTINLAASSTISFLGFNSVHTSSLYGSVDEIKVYTQAVTTAQAWYLYDPTPLCEVTIPDANFKYLLLANNSDIDTNNNEIIECSEAEAYAGQINVTYGNISDLTGIEQFPNITSLLCNNNQLTTLDVSANQNLTYVWFHHNQLTDLDLSVNSQLNYISCYNNELTNLNVANGNNTSFIGLEAYNNPNLTCIQVDNAAYSNANWVGGWFIKSYEASWSENCQAGTCVVTIPDANFKNALLNYGFVIDTNGDGEIQCSEAEAVTNIINVSGQNIIDLTGIEAFVNITGLECGYNQLTSLDVSSNTELTYLLCYYNQLTSLDVSSNPALNNLETHDNQLTSLDVSANPVLNYLACYNNQLTSLNIANGNNTNFFVFHSNSNPNLVCIQVDNAAYSNTYWTNPIYFVKDAGAIYSENCSLNTPDFDVQKITVYPNPTNGIVNISEMADVTVFDIQGRKIAESKNTTSLDLSSQTTGIYFAQITTEKGTETIKIIKQ